jgi:tryptophan 7-halogenase
MSDKVIQDILVVGGGSAGFLVALTLKIKIPTAKVRILRSPELGIIGVGEGTTPALPTHLFAYLNIDQGEFYRMAQPTWKLGIKLLWGPRPSFNYPFVEMLNRRYQGFNRTAGFYCADDFEHAHLNASLMSLDKVFTRTTDGDPRIGGDMGFHIENEKFVSYLEAHALKIGIPIVDGTVQRVDRDEAGVKQLHLTDGSVLASDLYVDCSGFGSLLLGKTLEEPFLPFKRTLFCDSAVVGSWARGADEPILPYTTAETMDSGWCWRIEHEHQVVRGYVYSTGFITDDAAEAEFRRKNPKVQKTRIVRFTPGRRQRNWVGNVIGIGNASGFVEPLEATSLTTICGGAKSLTEFLTINGMRITDSIRRYYNKQAEGAWEDTREFLGVHYKFNTRLDTPFWQECRASVDLGEAQVLVDYYRENGPALFSPGLISRPNSVFGVEGYMNMLVGQAVPHQNHYTPTADEQQRWQSIRQKNQNQAQQGFTVAEALAETRSPEWAWNNGFYRQTMY